MLKFHINLAEEATKILRTNFLEADLKVVIYSISLTRSRCDSLNFFFHFVSPFIVALHPPSVSPLYTSFQYFHHSSLSCSTLIAIKCAVCTQKQLTPPAESEASMCWVFTISQWDCKCHYGMKTPTNNNNIITAYQWWNLQTCFTGYLRWIKKCTSSDICGEKHQYFLRLYPQV